MKIITFDKIHEADRQEELPDYSDDYPCITTRAELARYPQQYMPWHWHQPVELFYIKSGELEYNTPAGKICFPAGSGGLLNSGVIHMTRPHLEKGTPIQLLHIFDPYFLVDSRDGLLARRYIKPFVDSSTELVLFSPEIPNHKKLLDAFIASFKLDENTPEAEMVLRNILAEIWVKLISLLPEANSTFGDPFISSRLRMMLEFIHTHYAERITVREIASAGTSSERDCYRLFQTSLHCTPNAYVTGFRLQKACSRLRSGQEAVTEIAMDCGFGSSSHFGKLFTARYNCSPLQYRKKWQDHDKTRHD